MYGTQQTGTFSAVHKAAPASLLNICKGLSMSHAL